MAKSALQMGSEKGTSGLQRTVIPGYSEGPTLYNIFQLQSSSYRISSTLLARRGEEQWSLVPFESRYIKQMAESDCLKICWRRCMKTMEGIWFLVQIWQGPLNMRCPGRNQILVHAVMSQGSWLSTSYAFFPFSSLRYSAGAPFQHHLDHSCQPHHLRRKKRREWGSYISGSAVFLTKCCYLAYLPKGQKSLLRDGVLFSERNPVFFL